MLLGHMPLSRDPRRQPNLQKAHTTVTGSSLLTTPSKLSTRPSVSSPPLTKSKTSVQEDDYDMSSIIVGTLLILGSIINEWNDSGKEMGVVWNLFKVNNKDTRMRSINVSLMSLWST